ncbi:MAG TPA: SMI1/KNR4 family protein [Caulobacteraceae bacterium]
MQLALGPPYSREDLERAQERWDLHFPPDLVDLYLEGRPLLGRGAIDWVATPAAEVEEALSWPLESFWFDVQEAALWWPEWGPRPATEADRRAVLEAAFREAPKLVPIYGHRYIPSRPAEAGNPVFSVYQSDVICYGATLADYLQRESNGFDSLPWPSPIKRVPFWSLAVERGAFQQT